MFDFEGEKVPLSAELWRKIRRKARKGFQGSQALFDASWNTYRRYLVSSIDDPEDMEDVTGWLDSIAAEKVNNSRSAFYIYG